MVARSRLFFIEAWAVLAGLALFVLQFLIAFHQPSWGLHSPFPYSVIRSPQMPLLMGLSAAAAIFMTENSRERWILGWIVAAAVFEILIIEAMLDWQQPILIVPVLAANAFMAVQFIRYSLAAGLFR